MHRRHSCWPATVVARHGGQARCPLQSPLSGQYSRQHAVQKCRPQCLQGAAFPRSKDSPHVQIGEAAEDSIAALGWPRRCSGAPDWSGCAGSSRYCQWELHSNKNNREPGAAAGRLLEVASCNICCELAKSVLCVLSAPLFLLCLLPHNPEVAWQPISRCMSGVRCERGSCLQHGDLKPLCGLKAQVVFDSLGSHQYRTYIANSSLRQ